MQIFTVILDHELPRNGTARPAASMLMTGLGTHVLLHHLLHEVIRDHADRVTIVPQFEPSAEYCEMTRNASDCRIAVVAPDQSRAWVRGLEPSDWLLIIDPKYAPIDAPCPLADVAEECEYPGATYWIANGASQDTAREIVQLDSDGNVRSIIRCLGRVTGLPASPAAIPYVLAPVWAVDDLSCESLALLRKSLVEREIPCHDISLPGRVLDLSIEQELLCLHDSILESATSGPLPREFSRLADGVLVGQGAVIHSTARIVPPVIIQANVTIERDATIIGPTVMVEGSRLGPGAFVARAIVPARTLVPGDFSVCHSSATDWDDPAHAGADPVAAGIQSSAPHSQRSAGDGVVPQEQEAKRQSKRYPALQRGIEFTIALISLILLSPLFAVLAIWIKLDSPGPVFFGHEREGRGGRRFRCFKFRTMQQNAHALQRELYQQNLVDGPQFKLAKDPRVTTAGRYLRDHNLDELPQLLNVLLGEMSLVGPRPSPFRENQICIPWRRGRLSVRPGITGLWQICRTDRGPGDFQQWIYYDLVYVRHQSLWLDVRILLATILTLGGRWSVPVEKIVPAAAGSAGSSHP